MSLGSTTAGTDTPNAYFSKATRIENKLPALTASRLQRLAFITAWLEFITKLLEHTNPGEQLKKLGQMIKEVFQLLGTKKHMSKKDLGRLEPTPSTKISGSKLNFHKSRNKNLIVEYIVPDRKPHLGMN